MMIINLFLWIGHSRMGRRTHENFQRSTSQAHDSIGKHIKQRSLCFVDFLVISNIIFKFKCYICRRWDTEQRVYLAAYHQTLCLFLMLSYLTSRKMSNHQLFYSLCSTTFQTFSYFHVYIYSHCLPVII